MRLRAATYNIHGCRGLDGRRDVERIGRIIAAMRADVVGLQEVDCRRRAGTAQLQRLSAVTGLRGIAGPTITSAHGYYGNAVLTRLVVLDVVRIDLSLPGHEPRGLLEVRVSVDGTPVRVLVTHFGLRARERRRQVDAVLARASGDGPLVLMGDFNEWHPRAASLRRLDGVLGPSPPVRSYPAPLPLVALDRVWVRPRRALRSLTAVRTRASRIASDHLPVAAEVDLSEPDRSGQA